MKKIFFVVAALAAVFSCVKQPTIENARQPVTNNDSRTIEVSSGGFTYRITQVDMGSWADRTQKSLVQSDLDQLSQGGINTVVVGAYYFMPLFFVDYSDSPYPEVSQVNSSNVASNIETINSNIAYAHSKNIKVLSGSYCHYAPIKFWRAHKSELDPFGAFTDAWLLKAHQSGLFESALNGETNSDNNNGVVPHQQWSNPVFKDFWVWSTRKMLDNLPGLDGFLNCYAESAWTYDQQKLAATGQDSISRDMVATDNDFVDYVNTLWDILTEKRGADNFQIGMRDWYMDMSLLLRCKVPPAKLIISIKYAGYDAPLVNFPTWGATLHDDGFGVVFDIQLYDAEFPAPIYWYDNAFINQIFTNIAQAGFPGVAYHDFKTSNDQRGNPICIMTKATATAALQGSIYDRNDAMAYLTSIYGKGAGGVMISLECVTSAQADNIKLTPAWFCPGDGLTSGGMEYNRLWKFGDLSGVSLDFVRQDVVGMPEYCRAVLANPARNGLPTDTQLQAWKDVGKRTPVEAMASMEDAADKGIAAMDEARTIAGYGDKFGELFASAVIHKQLVARDVAFMRGTMAYLICGGNINADAQNSSLGTYTDTGINQKQIARDQYTEYVYRDKMLVALCAMYAPRQPSIGSTDYSYVNKALNFIKAQPLTFDNIVVDQNELNGIVNYIKNL